MPGGIPADLDAQRGLGADWGAWLDRLPRLRDEVLAEWGLRADGHPAHGFCSLVQPVRTEDGAAAALKLTFDGDDESEHEGLALQHWHGDGAVRLLRADPHRRALLLERLHTRDLSDAWDLEACEVVAGLYGRLHRPALPQLRSLTAYVERWLDQLAVQGRDLPVPPRMVEQTLHVGRALATDAASTAVVVHGDLHYANVLAADREPWLAIDPKAMNGDPHYEPAPMLWNRADELTAGGQSLRDGLRRRFHTLVDAAELDEARARDWVLVRMVLNASWSVADAQRQDRAPSAEERDWITLCIAIAKAVQD